MIKLNYQPSKSPWSEEAKNHACSLAEKYYEAVNNTSLGKELLKGTERGLCICANNPSNGILITGINPSGKDDSPNFAFSFRDSIEDALKDKKQRHWRDKAEEYTGNNPNVIDELKMAYLDLFPFHKGKQAEFMSKIKGSENDFQRKVIEVTQSEIEDYIHPRLIIHANASTSYYWGLDKKSVWMGYNLVSLDSSEIPDELESLVGRLFRIRGFKTDADRINSEKYNKTNLEGSLFLRHGLYNRPNQKRFRLNAEKVKALYKLAMK